MRYLTTFLTLLATMVSCSQKKDTTSGDLHPNVLFIAVDDLNDWTGTTAGHLQAITPHLDRLAEQGVLFANAHCSQAVCTASRNSLLSGLHPATTGWYGSTSDMRKTYDAVMGGNTMLPQYFKEHGYKTMSTGKIFHDDETDYPDKRDAFWDVYSPHFWDDMEDHIRENGYGYRGMKFYPFPKSGGQLVQLYGEDTINSYYRKENRFYSLCGGPLDAEDIPEDGMYDEQIADWAVGRLQEQHEKPFFLAVGFYRPHVPYTAPREYFDMYDAESLSMPDIPEDEMADIPPIGKAIAYGYTPRGGWADVQAKPGFLRELVHSYLACVTFADAQVGKVLDALEHSAYADNTIVVLWSDHGQHLGEKRHFRKQALWEEATKVPLIIAAPGMKHGMRSSRPVSLLDLYPTLLSLCDLPENKALEGHDLTPILQDPQAEWPHYVLSVWRYKNYAVRSERYRYIQYRDGTEELYDHRDDPGEHRNVAGNPVFAQILEDHRKHLPDREALPAGDSAWKGDKYDQMVQQWEEEGYPEWLE
jgi:iduronate 2-sulfatase